MAQARMQTGTSEVERKVAKAGQGAPVEAAAGSLKSESGQTVAGREGVAEVKREPLNTTRFIEDIISQAKMLSRPDGSTEMRLRLDPPELGSLLMRLTLKNNKLEVQLEVDSPAVRQMVGDTLQSIRKNVVIQSKMRVRIGGEPGAKTSPEAIRKSMDSSLQASLKALKTDYIDTMLIHDPGTRLGRDSEALHQMRVATRRMRAIFRSVRTFLEPEWTKKIRQEVGWIGSLLGEVRDWDVLLESLGKEYFGMNSKEERGKSTGFLAIFTPWRESTLLGTRPSRVRVKLRGRYHPKRGCPRSH